MTGPQFITLDVAAQRSGRSVGHLRRLCNQRWRAAGLARETRSARNQPTWEVREDADPALCPVKFPEQLDQAFDFRTLSERHRRLLLQRKQILDGWYAARSAAATLGFSELQATAQYLQRLQLDQGVVVARRTLYNWHDEYRAAGIGGLVDKRWRTSAAPGGDAKAADPFLDECRRLYLSPKKRSKKLCYDKACDAAEERGWSVPSLRTACRYLEAIPLRTLKLYREGDEGYRAVASYVERDYESLDSNDVWFADHHPLDLLVVIDGKPVRPYLTAWMDARSRMFVGWRIVAHAPNSDTILAAFRDAALAHGVPRAVYIDNGKDFDAYALQGVTKRQRQRGVRPSIDTGVFGELGVDVHHATPYTPQAKTIERHFRVVSERFTKDFDTHTGNCPADKPYDLTEQLKRGKAPTLDEVIASFGDWLDADHHASPKTGHGMNGRSPADVFAACLRAKRTAPASLLEVLTLKRTQPLKVGRNGVSLGQITYGRDLPQLVERQGKPVILRYDDADRSRVQVYEVDGRFVCVAAANERLPMLARDSQAVRDALAEQRRDRRLHKQFIEARPRLTDNLSDRLYRKAERLRRKAADAPKGDQPPPSIVPVRAALEDQLPALQRALEAPLRVAVGAESVSLSDVGDALRGAHVPGDVAEDAFAALGRALHRDGEE